MKKIMVMIGCLMFLLSAFAQIEHPVKWAYAAKMSGKDEAIVLLKATIENGWHIYSVKQPEGGPVKTSFVFAPGEYTLVGKVDEPQPLSRFEKVFNMKVAYFEHEVIFSQKIRLKSASSVVRGKLTFMVCNDQKCLAPEEVNFSVPVK